MQAVPTQTFGKYQILEKIASGMTAEIYKARMEGIGGFSRSFAIKRIRPELSRNRDYIELLVDEAKVAGLLSHANIVQILDLGEVDGLYFLAMEYVDGRDLGSVLGRCKDKGITLPVPHAVFALIEMLKGLEYAHQRQIMRGNRPVPLNVIHRDISPSNVLVSFQGEVKLTDFGIARANVKAMATVPGVVQGRFDYMSPEQAAGHDIDQRSDIFSAGTLLYEMVCGIHPFRKPGDVDTLDAIKHCRYEAPSFANPDVPYGLEVILDQAMAKDPEERFHSSTAFKEALSNFFHDAGFIFTHSTLAAFLKGLFPEVGRKRRAVTQPDDDATRPLEPGDLEGFLDQEDEDPETEMDATAVLSRSQFDEQLAQEIEEEDRPTTVPPFQQLGHAPGGIEWGSSDAPSLPEMELPDPEEWDQDPKTEIRDDPLSTARIPKHDDTHTHAQVDVDLLAQKTAQLPQQDMASLDLPEPEPEPGHEDFGDESTRIRRKPAAVEAHESAQPVVAAVVQDFDATGPVASQRVEEPVATERKRAKTATAREPAPQTRFSKRTWLFLGLASFVTATLGVALGLLIGILGRELIPGNEPEAIAPVEIREQPRLSVTLPEGAVLEVGGRARPLNAEGATDLTLTADEATEVRVSMDGYQTYETTLTLTHNEVRMLGVELVQLQER